MADKLKGKILGIGIDIENIERFRKLPFIGNQSFYRKIFIENEINYCLSFSDPYPHFAVRFSAKEALVKALPYKVQDWLDMEVFFKKEKPHIKIRGLSNKIHLSLAHCNDYAIASVCIEAV